MRRFNWFHKSDRLNFLTHLRFILTSSQISPDSFTTAYAYWDKVSLNWWQSAYWSEYAQGSQLILEYATKLKNREICAKCLSQIASFHMYWNNNYSTAQRLFLSAFLAYHRTPDPFVRLEGQHHTLRDFGTTIIRQNNYLLAGPVYFLSWLYLKKLMPLAKSPRQQTLSRLRQAEIYNLSGNLLYHFIPFRRLSRRLLQQSLRHYQSLGKKYHYFQAAPLINLGRLSTLTGDYRKAAYYFRQCAGLSLRLKRWDTYSGALFRLSEVYELQGLPTKAKQARASSLRISRNPNHPLYDLQIKSSSPPAR